MVEQTKWVKAKSKLQWVSKELESGPDVEYKPLESIRGFLVYVAQAYHPMIPYLWGFHGTLDSWRPDRTKDDFDGRLNAELLEVRVDHSGPKRRKVIDSKEEAAEYDPSSLLDPKFGIDVEDVNVNQAVLFSSDKPGGANSLPAQQQPCRVTLTSCMKDNSEALFQKTQDVSPPKRRVRSLRVVCATYGFGDASGDGFGAAILPPDGKIFYRHGVWNWLISNEHSSNYRELRNLVESLEKAAAAGHLTNTEVYQQHHCGSRLLPRFFQVKATPRFGVETPVTGNEALHCHTGYSCVRKKNDQGRREWCVPG
jgi:hypothetical protein